MKPANIVSLLQAKSSLNEADFNAYLHHHGITIKKAELDDLAAFANSIKGAGANVGDFNKIYFGYKIPQIGKEFDLLRFCRESIINIELKSVADPAKIHAQLLRNKYYLNFIGRTVYAFTFVSSTGALYQLAENNQLVTISPIQLQEILSKQAADEECAPDSLFNPSDYLVSPFNSTKKFLDGEYFLTHQQEEFKGQILKSIDSAPSPKFAAITGSAGTGKTLLTFDIAKHLLAQGKKVLTIHCGHLNGGHLELIKNGWIICAIRSYKQHDIEKFDAIVIDEAQRIYPNQLSDIVSKISAAKNTCIFSYDKVQTLANNEVRNDIAGKIDAIASITQYRLSEKIRTNKEIASFIKLLFSNKKPAQPQRASNIQIDYFNNNEDAKSYLNSLSNADWEVLRFTPSQYNKEHHENYFDAWSKTSHQVIGQEFDGVAIAVDRFFTYDDAGDLVYKGGAYYAPTKMLFQNITRARKRLNLIIIGNQQLLSRCLSILE
jgi:uncharacterized Zn finger protein (UPF0148 family)